MPLTETEARKTIESLGFKVTYKTSKVVEYTEPTKSRVLYLRLGQGFPRHADVVVNPEIPASSMLAVSGVRVNPTVELRFGSNMKTFPLALNEGKEPEHYGRALQADSPEALDKLCREYARLP